MTDLVFDSIPDTIAAFRAGEFVVVMDDASRENEGDLIVAAESISAAQMAFMIRYTSGIVCVPLPADRCDALGLPPMVPADRNQDAHGTAYTLTVDAHHPSVTTGISAADRALVCRQLASPSATAADFRRPGHVFPLRAREGGVRTRRGHTEAGIELCRLAGRQPAAVISELVDEGTEPESARRPQQEQQGQRPRIAELVGAGMLRGAGCVAFARKWGLRVCSMEDLVRYVEAEEGS